MLIFKLSGKKYFLGSIFIECICKCNVNMKLVCIKWLNVIGRLNVIFYRVVEYLIYLW